MGWINVCVMYPTVFPKSVSFYLTRTYSISMWCALRISALHLDVKREWKPFEISQNKKASKVSEWVSELQWLENYRYPFKEFVHLMATQSLSSLLSISSSSSLRSLGINATTFHFSNTHVFMHLLTPFFLTEDYWMLFHLSCFELNCWFTLFLIEEGLAIQISNNFVCILILFSFIVKSYSGFSDLIIFTAKKW